MKTAILHYQGEKCREIIVETPEDLDDYHKLHGDAFGISDIQKKVIAERGPLRFNELGGWCAVSDLGIDPATLVIKEI
jgi:hypothetical protein